MVDANALMLGLGGTFSGLAQGLESGRQGQVDLMQMAEYQRRTELSDRLGRMDALIRASSLPRETQAILARQGVFGEAGQAILNAPESFEVKRRRLAQGTFDPNFTPTAENAALFTALQQFDPQQRGLFAAGQGNMIGATFAQQPRVPVLEYLRSVAYGLTPATAEERQKALDALQWEMQLAALRSPYGAMLSDLPQFPGGPPPGPGGGGAPGPGQDDAGARRAAVDLLIQKILRGDEAARGEFWQRIGDFTPEEAVRIQEALKATQEGSSAGTPAPAAAPIPPAPPPSAVGPGMTQRLLQSLGGGGGGSLR
jgi:hypothetical protein